MFDRILEHGASTLETGILGIEQAVWGVESPLSYKSKQKKLPTLKRRDQEQQKQKQRASQQDETPKQKSKSKQNRFFRTPTTRRGNASDKLANSNYSNQGTPSTVADSWGEASSATDPYSILEIDNESTDESEGVPLSQRRRSWKHANVRSSSRTNVPSPTNLSIDVKTNYPQHKLQQKLESGTRSIDEIFGYNTKKTIKKKKSSLDQDVGLDFMLLDVPSPTNNLKKRSLLIVQRIDPCGLFARTDLGVGDAILSINGTSFGEQTAPRYARSSGHGGFASEKPNLFKARALLNGRARTVTIEYRKFGETNKSVCSSTFTPIADAVPQNQPPPSSLGIKKKFSSSARQRGPTSNRVDFLGRIQTNVPSNNSRKGKTSSRIRRARATTFFDSESSDDDYEPLMHQHQKYNTPPKFKPRTQKHKSNTETSDETNEEQGQKNSSRSNDKQDVSTPSQETTPAQKQMLPIPILKQSISCLSPEIDSTTSKKPKDVAHSPARSVWSDSKLSGNSPARSTRSESYLEDLRKTLSPTANAILAELSTSKEEVNEPTQQQQQQHDSESSQMISPVNLFPEGNLLLETTEISLKELEKLNLRIEFLNKNNLQLKSEVASLKQSMDTTSQKLAQAEKQKQQSDAKDKVYTNQLKLLKSRLEIATIQSDKRQRELLEAKEKSIAENDKVISNLSKRIETLESTNKRLVEQLKKVETKRQEKQTNLQAQFDRLKMKFSAQSTLLDNVMTSNEELTSQNEAMESELHAYTIAAGAKTNSISNQRPPLSPVTTTGMLFAEGSENELEHIKRDPILLAQAKELSSCKERNSQLEDQIESLSRKLADAMVQLKAKPPMPVVIKRHRESPHTPSLLDATDTSSFEDNDENNVSMERSSDEGGLNPLPSLLQASFSSEMEEVRNPTNTYQLEYEHKTEKKTSDDDDMISVSLSNHDRQGEASMSKIADESFDSVTSQILIDRILELEIALQKTNLEPEESEKFLVALQSRIAKLTARGYEKVEESDSDEACDKEEERLPSIEG